MYRPVAPLLTPRLATGGRDGSPLGPVYVGYSSLEEAKAAERALNSGELASQIGSVQVVARFAAELHHLPFSGNDVPSRTLYLGRVPQRFCSSKARSYNRSRRPDKWSTSAFVCSQPLFFLNSALSLLASTQRWKMAGRRHTVTLNSQK